MPNPAFISALKSDRCVHYLNNTLINRAQSFDLNANIPSSVIDELGNENHVGIVSDIADVSFNLSAYDTGLDLTRLVTGKTSGTSFVLKDFTAVQSDYVGVIRDDQGTFYRSVYVRGASVNNISYSFDASGNAFESYGFVADNLTVFNGYVLTKTYTITATDVTNGYITVPTTGSEAPVQTKTNSYFNGAYLLRATKTVSGVSTNLVEGSGYDYTYTAATKRITPVSSAAALVAGHVWTLVFYSAAIGTALNPVFSTTLASAVKGRFIPLSIGLSTKTWIPRVQSARISVSFSQGRITQLGSSQALHAPTGAPSVGGSFSVLMNDLSLRKLLTYGSAGSAETQLGIEQMPAYGAANNLGLEVVIKSPADGTTVLKKITVPDIVTTAGGMPGNVNGLLTESFNWTGRTGALTITNS